MSTTCPSTRRRQSGFSIVAAIFILVVLATLGAFVVSVSTTQNITFTQDIQGARAYQAARAGIEYAIARWLGSKPSDSAVCPNTIGGAPTTATLTALDGFSTEVRTTLVPSGGINFCTIEATARPTGMSAANVGSIGYIERQLRAVVEGN